jgi:hypothetical protein
MLIPLAPLGLAAVKTPLSNVTELGTHELLIYDWLLVPKIISQGEYSLFILIKMKKTQVCKNQIYLKATSCREYL